MKMEKRSYDMRTRSAKAEATRDRIRQNAMQLYRERPLDEFTLDEVAARAETTVQTVLRAFSSKDNLIVVALAALAPGGSPIKLSDPGDVAAAVMVIFDLYENIGDRVIQQLADERRLPGLKTNLDVGRRIHREWVKAVFAPQLGTYTGHGRSHVFHGLMAATDVYVWKLLRRDQGLHRATAEAVVRRIITGLTKQE